MKPAAVLILFSIFAPLASHAQDATLCNIAAKVAGIATLTRSKGGDPNSVINISLVAFPEITYPGSSAVIYTVVEYIFDIPELAFNDLLPVDQMDLVKIEDITFDSCMAQPD